ncbi:MAG TPA: xanthine dehydrogenase family protein, partial [Isosphaeraceae bacterium]|nr:xanthine dehydrogenase family protein [Isosphaeraceae bacterium]
MTFHDPSTAVGRFVSLGQSVPRQEGVSMLIGAARFVDDWAKDGVWIGGTVRSTEAHARLQGVRCNDSFDWARVVMVTAADVPGRNVLELVENDQPVLAESILRHPEEPVALVAAPDKETLQRALEAITLEIEPLEPVFDVDAALTGRVRIFGDDNVFKRIEITKGDAAGALEAAAVVIEAEYTTGSQEHVYLETQGMQAEWDGHGVTIRGSLQCPYDLARGVSVVLGLTPERVRVVQVATGGAFGGKEDYPTLIAAHAALLARKAGRPVRIVYKRSEDMRATTKRHPSRIRHRTGFTRDGRLRAMAIDLVLDGGAYATLSPWVLSRAAVHASGPYQCDNLHITARAVATNRPPCGAFRGFGAPQALFALEAHLDYCATRLGLDPVGLRRTNLIRPGGALATGQRVRDDTRVEEVLDRALAESRFRARREEFAAFNRRGETRTGRDRFRRRGIGVSLLMHGTGLFGDGELETAAEFLLRGHPDGIVRVATAQTELGQGTRTILAQAAA